MGAKAELSCVCSELGDTKFSRALNPQCDPDVWDEADHATGSVWVPTDVLGKANIRVIAKVEDPGGHLPAILSISMTGSKQEQKFRAIKGGPLVEVNMQGEINVTGYFEAWFPPKNSGY